MSASAQDLIVQIKKTTCLYQLKHTLTPFPHLSGSVFSWKRNFFSFIFKNTSAFTVAFSNRSRPSTRIRILDLKTITAYFGNQVVSPSTRPSWYNLKFLRSCLSSSSVKTFKNALLYRGWTSPNNVKSPRVVSLNIRQSKVDLKIRH